MRLHNKYKTHCPHGHEYSAENTRLVGGKRHCITCHRQRNLEGYYRRQEQAEENNRYQTGLSDNSYSPSDRYSTDTSSSPDNYSADTTSSDIFNGGGGGDFGGGGASGDY